MIRIYNHYISTVFLVLFVIEYCIFFVAMYFGNELRFLYTQSWYSDSQIVLESFLFATTLSISMAGIGLYRRNLGLTEYELLSRTSVAFSVSILVLVTVYYISPDFIIARSILVYALIISLIGMLICRYMFNKLAGKSLLQKKILLIGSGNNANKILNNKSGYIHKGFDIIGCFSTTQEKTIVPIHAILNADDANKTIFDIVHQHKINEIVVALDDRRSSMPVNELLDCKISGIKIIDLLSFYEREKACLDLENLKPSWMVFSDGFAQSGLRTILKRLVDISASFFLLVLALPVMLFTVLAIYLESGFRAPIIYRQTRVGENNKNFDVLKFRSMKTDAEAQGIQFAKVNDTRITKVGTFIRKARIDELPQIFNVFKGDMSFVGPRPERPIFVEEFEKNIPYYRERHRIKPGITGWAQLCYPYGENEYDAIQKLQYDLYYVKNYSLFLDLTIIIHTVEVVLWGKGAR
ncbi:MAG: TIGR03013 family PEP-CTERM/XrtA system glycosyltransferase [Methylococcaceae bacterium]|nr:TIGR03013 family PEP-CTERM/XrtA system glycosyltransferase [Methylococcaceae bacterium]